MTNVEFVETVPDDIEKEMRNDLIEYESSHGVDVNYRAFSLVLKHENGDAIGVLNAFTAYAEIYIDDMWIHSKYRKQGYGKKLISELENKFTGKGFNNINLCTSDFNAPKFYEKCGFIVEFTRVNRINPKLTKTFFVKYFNENEQTQGIISPAPRTHLD